MRALVDTHVLLWVAEGALDARSHRQLAAADAVLLSAASIWEIEIKRARGRLAAPRDLTQQALDAGFEELSITFEHAREAGRLPLQHRDPFDRMLVAQARLEGLTLVTADASLSEYDVPVVEAARA